MVVEAEQHSHLSSFEFLIESRNSVKLWIESDY